MQYPDAPGNLLDNCRYDSYRDIERFRNPLKVLYNSIDANSRPTQTGNENHWNLSYVP
jgi:hypothetical protein